MTDSNIQILKQIELDAFTKEVLRKTTNAAIVWSQLDKTQYKATAVSSDGFDHWTFFLNKNPVNTPTDYIAGYTLDVLLNNQAYLSVGNATTQELYDTIESSLRGGDQAKLHNASSFVQQLTGADGK